MNRPPEEFVRIAEGRLVAFATQCLQAAGMLEEHARQLARLLVDSDLRGVRSHGTRALSGYCHTVREGRVNNRPDIRVVAETDVAVLVDGDGALGYAPTMLATEKCIEKAKAKGTAVGAARGIGHYGSAAHYVRRATEEGLIGFSVQSASPTYYPSNQGRRLATYGNPPLCFGLPGQEEHPIVLDGATCILADDQRGEALEALEALVPAAFFKSVGYTAVGTALGGPFAGQSGQRARQIAEKWPHARLGSMVWLVDPGLFAPAEEFRRAVDEQIRRVRAEMVPLAGYDEATLPGAVEHRLEQEYRRHGIKTGLREREHLAELGAELGVPVPWD